MPFNALLNEDRILTHQEVSSKKRLLEMISPLLMDEDSPIEEEDIFSCMLERERLGSTAIGHGVAIPHSRLEGVEEAKIAVITLAEGVNYDAPDGEEVDIVFALLVPEEHTEEHLNILSWAATLFSCEENRNAIRNAQTPKQLLHYLNQHIT